ncbi:MAG: hypothetical protein NWQ53_04535 [Flavobacteriales bacterium]|jgi:hypothetical protein|nr:hypothetical protein [Bacteroidota bacterium]MDP4952889.1 hypothetical protein [Flavobacteriales bacterium]
MEKHKFDKLYFGLITGVLGALVGFFIFATGWILANDRSMNYFINEVFLNSELFKSRIISVSILFDVLLFFLVIRKEWYNFAKGILAVVIVSVPLALYFY